jgi:hypothetical protein
MKVLAGSFLQPPPPKQHLTAEGRGAERSRADEVDRAGELRWPEGKLQVLDNFFPCVDGERPRCCRHRAACRLQYMLPF